MTLTFLPVSRELSSAARLSSLANPACSAVATAVVAAADLILLTPTPFLALASGEGSPRYSQCRVIWLKSSVLVLGTAPAPFCSSCFEL